ncbi:MAG: single-stranded-DNA-specific exonuclease RecJ [Bryobacteraceae bacterium]
MRWILPRPDPLAGALAEALQIDTLPAQVLCARGQGTPEAARRFLHPSLGDLHDPYLLRGMDAAAARLRAAVEQGEKILIYGDYDADGATAVVILKKAIELAGGQAEFHIPHRLSEGYGMRPEVVREAAGQGVRLIVSVDTGIRAAQVVALASGLGIDVIVTDHHLPDAQLPPALAVLNPNRPDCDYPDKNLCGAGVAFKLAQALLAGCGWSGARLARVTESFLKVVAIGTIADVVPLTGENRVMVRHGLEGLGDARNPGLRALLDVAGVARGSTPTAGQVAFRIAPRINAAGRMDSALAAIELFLTSDDARARELAKQLDAFNQERQQTEEEIVARILEECLCENIGGRRALVFCGDGWHRGVLGVAASRVVERFHRPVFVLSREEGLLRGSGRSIPGFHLLAALEAMPELFERFGGHAGAAGVTLSEANLDAFRERFDAYAAARLAPEDLEPCLEIDAVVDLAALTDTSVMQVLDLAPFGCGNPQPLFAALDVEVAGQPRVWKDRHLRLNVQASTRLLPLKGWNMAERAAELAHGARVDIAFTLEEDAWSASQGLAPWCAVLRDVRAATRIAAA